MRNFIGILFLLSSFWANAQKTPSKAERLYRDYSFVEASKAYEEFLQKEKNPDETVLEHAAESFYFIGDKTNAAKYYKQLYDKKGTAISETTFHRLISSLQFVGENDLVNQIASAYFSGNNAALAKDYEHQKKIKDSLAGMPPLFEVKNLEINSDKSDFGPAFYGNKIVYASSKNFSKDSKKNYSWNEQPFLELYVADRNLQNGSLYNDMLFLPKTQTEFHDATVSFSPDLQWVYFSTSNVRRKNLINNNVGTNNFKISRGKFFNNNLTEKEDLKFSSVDYSVGHPHVTSDGKWLYFSSDMPGGYGGADLYRAAIASDGSLGEPENLGENINTVLNDVFPFFVNNHLYFASEGHFGYGGLDVFRSDYNLENNYFSLPKNLGTPINSTADDFAFILTPEETEGYFSSNRDGGKGDDDIYYFTKKALCNQYVSGYVTNVRNQMPIAGATLKVYLNSGESIIETTSDNAGFYRVNVPCDVKIKFLVTKPGFNVEFGELKTTAKNQDELRNVNFQLVRYEDLIISVEEVEKIDINPIYFDYNKADITSKAEDELEKVLYAMNKFPEINIKIETHTDSRGNDAYNLDLSEQRAQSVLKYLLQKGITQERIESAIGYGESRLINRCDDGVKCSEAEHLQNRRSDFIVVKK